MNCCPMCDSTEAKFLGTLGSLDHLRCADCGITYSADNGMGDEDEVEGDFERDVDCDDGDDGWALASAGMGMDEDYGGHSDIDDF